MSDTSLPTRPIKASVATSPNPGGNVAGHSLIYVIGSAISVAGGVLMVPVYTHALSSSDYGLLDTILRFVMMCMNVAVLGIRQAYQRLYFDKRTSAGNRALTSTVLLANFAIAIGVLLPLLIVASTLGRAFGAGEFTIARSVILSIWVAFEATYMIGLSYLQIRLRSTQFVITQSSRLLVLIAINYSMLNIFHLGLDGALAGNVIASVLSGSFTAAILLRASKIRVSTKLLRELVGFGIPYIPTVLFSYVIANADRLALIHYGGVASLGLLALASKIGELALMIFIGPVDNVWSPYAFSIFGEQSGPKRIGTLYTKFVAMCVFMALGVSLLAPLGISLLAHSDYEFASRLVPIIALGWVFYVMTTLSDIGILIAKRTWMKPLCAGIASVIAVALQFVLTPRYGVIGAATATVLTNMALFFIVRVISQRFYRMTTRPRDFLVIVASASVILLAGVNLNYVHPTSWAILAVTFVGLAAYGGILLGAGIIQKADLRFLSSRLGGSFRFIP